MREAVLQEIFRKTGGRCHFCGDRLEFGKRGRGGGARGVDDVPAGYWEVDHVAQVSRNGARRPGNCLPACVACNRLRWHRVGAYTRTTVRLGLVARATIKKGGPAAEELLKEAKRRWPRVTDWPTRAVRRHT
jgi:hypothetical protein